MVFPGLRAAFFDIDFTLIHPGPVFQGEGYGAFCARYGVLDCDPAAFESAVASASALLDDSPGHAFDPRVFVRYIRRIIEQMGGSGDGIDACALEIYREWAACRHFRLYDDVVPVLQALGAAGLQVGLISNTHRSLDAFREHFALDGLVSVAVSSSEHGYNKPHPSIFRAALGLAGASPAEAVMVGDSYGHDVEGALAVGMHAVWLRRAGGGAAPRAGVPVIASLHDLPALLGVRSCRPAPDDEAVSATRSGS